MSNNTTQSSGIGFGGLLLLTFIILKLTKDITWSWVWVLSPLWIPVSIALVVIAVYAYIQVYK